LEEEDMKINILFILVITPTIQAFSFFDLQCVKGVLLLSRDQVGPDLWHGLPAHENTARMAVPRDASETIENSSGSWRLHEPFKDCVACHGEESQQATADNPHIVAAVPTLCYGCHKKYVSPDGWLHGPVATGDCLLCHEPHKTKNKSLLIKTTPDLCYRCHETKMLKLVANHSGKSYAHCSDCHEGHTSPGRMLLKQDFFKTDAGLDYIRKNPSAQLQYTYVDRLGSLSGLSGVKVVAVVEESDLFKRYGLTADSIKAKVEARLKQNGVRIIGSKEPIERQSWLYIYLRLMKVPSNPHSNQVDALSGSLNLCLRQKVELLGAPDNNKKRFCTATTWDTSGIVIWAAAKVQEGLDETIKVLVDQFSRDYLDANSADQQP
jgi:predicted CXXCH cytochrome family protein